jgi:lactate dehydrogenase-like 2-hydroxyacid dehydrogenase
MKRRPIINVSRDGLVDSSALARALETGELSGAGIDVFEDEPNVPDELRRLENIVLTPHVAWYSEEAVTASPELGRGNSSGCWPDKRPKTRFDPL